MQLKKYLHENNVICPQEHSFVTNRTSSSTTIVTLAQITNSARHKDQLAISGVLSIKMPLVVANHLFLINDLHKHGTVGNLLKFLAS